MRGAVASGLRMCALAASPIRVRDALPPLQTASGHWLYLWSLHSVVFVDQCIVFSELQWQLLELPKELLPGGVMGNCLWHVLKLANCSVW